MATRKKNSGRRYSKKASNKVARTMREAKRGTLRSGRSGKKVKSRKQAIAIGLSEARREGDEVPSRSKKSGGSSKKTSSRKKAGGSKKASGTRQSGARKKSGGRSKKSSGRSQSSTRSKRSTPRRAGSTRRKSSRRGARS